MKTLGLVSFCFLVVSLTATEQRFPRLAFAAIWSPHGVNADLSEKEAVRYNETHSAGSDMVNTETLKAATIYPPEFPFPEQELRDSINLPQHAAGPSAGIPANAINVELPAAHAENTEMSTYELQVEKERQARKRMSRAGLMLRIVVAVLFLTMTFGGDVMIQKMREEPGISLINAIPGGLTGNLIRLGWIISAFGPMLTAYLTICFFRWLRHYRILMKLRRNEVAALGGIYPAAQTSNPHAAAAASPEFSPQ